MANEDITQVDQVIPSDTERLPSLPEKLPGMIDEGDVLVFASKKAIVDEDPNWLREALKFRVAAVHGDKDQGFRMEILQKFKSGIYHVLIATDVAARGLDIKSIKSVVNFDIAKDMDMCHGPIALMRRAARNCHLGLVPCQAFISQSIRVLSSTQRSRQGDRVDRVMK